MKIPFSPPYIDDDILSEVNHSLLSGWITTGPKVKALEAEIKRHTNATEVLCVNSWTSGAILMLDWFGVQAGDEVIVPAYTYSATALAVLHKGATPVMVDVKADFTLEVEAVKSKITERTKVIMPVDFAGYLCDYESINALVREPEVKAKFKAQSDKQEALGRILVLADAAHSIGAKLNGIPSGNLADITIFSLHAVKNVTTAEGGAICLTLPVPFNNEDEYVHLTRMSLNGQTKNALEKSKAGAWKYDIINMGFKFNMPDVCAAIGLVQMRKYNEQILLERQRVFNEYGKFFAQFDWPELPPGDDARVQSCYHLYALRIKGITEEQRDQMIQYITEQGVAVNVHFIPMPMLTLFKNLGYSISDYPITYDNYSREISLPIYPQLGQQEIELVTQSVLGAYQSLK